MVTTNPVCRIGNTLNISLGTNPSTGYGWEFGQEPNPDILYLESNYVVENPPPGMVGVPGTEYWKYTAVGAGTTVILLEYLRSWETEPPLKIFRVQIIVTE